VRVVVTFYHRPERRKNVFDHDRDEIRSIDPIPRTHEFAQDCKKPLGSVLGFGCEDAWGQQITESDPSQQLGANPI
jgi:hypothetical protein